MQEGTESLAGVWKTASRHKQGHLQTPSFAWLLSPITYESSWLAASHFTSNPSPNSDSSTSQVYAYIFLLLYRRLKPQPSQLLPGSYFLAQSKFSPEREGVPLKDSNILLLSTSSKKSNPWHNTSTPCQGKGMGVLPVDFISLLSQNTVFIG